MTSLVVEVMSGLNDEPVLNNRLSTLSNGSVGLNLNGGRLVGSKVSGNITLNGGGSRGRGGDPRLDRTLSVSDSKRRSLVALDFLDIKVLDKVASDSGDRHGTSSDDDGGSALEKRVST